jgi:hypothetical protein
VLNSFLRKNFSGRCLTEISHPVILFLCLLIAFADLDREYVAFVDEIGFDNTACDWTETGRCEVPSDISHPCANLHDLVLLDIAADVENSLDSL